jgi:phage shock protein C
MYCNHCGKQIQDDANVCAYCGRQLRLAGPGRILERPRDNRRIAGVCAGLAHYLEIDVTLVRLLWAIIGVMTGIFPGIIAYFVAWIVMPEAPLMLPAVRTEPLTNP